MKCNKRKRSAFENRIVRFISSRSFDSTRLDSSFACHEFLRPSVLPALRIRNRVYSLRRGKKKKKNSFYARERVVPQKEDRGLSFLISFGNSLRVLRSIGSIRFPRVVIRITCVCLTNEQIEVAIHLSLEGVSNRFYDNCKQLRKQGVLRRRGFYRRSLNLSPRRTREDAF